MSTSVNKKRQHNTDLNDSAVQYQIYTHSDLQCSVEYTADIATWPPSLELQSSEQQSVGSVAAVDELICKFINIHYHI